jgi:hypothetical protein
VSKAELYREQARRCELQLQHVEDIRLRQQLRRERQEWLDLAASREAVERRSFTGPAPATDPRPLDEEMTLSALRAFEAGPGRPQRHG